MGMTRVLAKQLGDEGIPVNAVMPEWCHPRNDGTLPGRNVQSRDGQSGDQAEALIAFLVSDHAEIITGQMILCDGGGYLH